MYLVTLRDTNTVSHCVTVSCAYADGSNKSYLDGSRGFARIWGNACAVYAAALPITAVVCTRICCDQ